LFRILTRPFAPFDVNFTIEISLLGIPNSSITLHSFLLLTLSYAALKSTNNWCISTLYSLHFSKICLILNSWSDVERPTRKPHWYSPRMSSVYGRRRLYRIFAKVLYATFKRAIPL